jgi:hypothetical protein
MAFSSEVETASREENASMEQSWQQVAPAILQIQKGRRKAGLSQQHGCREDQYFEMIGPPQR